MQDQTRQYFENYEKNQRGVVIIQCFLVGALIFIGNFILFGYTEIFKGEPIISGFLMAIGLAVFCLTVKTAMSTFENLKQLEKRDRVLVLIALNANNILPALYIREEKGYPVLTTLKDVRRDDLIAGYMDHLEGLWQRDKYNMQQSEDPVNAKMFAEKMLAIQALPTWIEMQKEHVQLRRSTAARFAEAEAQDGSRGRGSPETVPAT